MIYLHSLFTRGLLLRQPLWEVLPTRLLRQVDINQASIFLKPALQGGIATASDTTSAIVQFLCQGIEQLEFNQEMYESLSKVLRSCLPILSTRQLQKGQQAPIIYQTGLINAWQNWHLER